MMDLTFPPATVSLKLKGQCSSRHSKGQWQWKDIDPSSYLEAVLVNLAVGGVSVLGSEFLTTYKKFTKPLTSGLYELQKMVKNPWRVVDGVEKPGLHQPFILSGNELIRPSFSPYIVKAEDWMTDIDFLMAFGEGIEKLTILYLDSLAVVTYIFTEGQKEDIRLLAQAASQYLDGLYADPKTEEKINFGCSSCPVRSTCAAYKNVMSSDAQDLNQWLEKAVAVGLDDPDVRIGLINARDVAKAKKTLFENVGKKIDTIMIDFAAKNGGKIELPDMGMGVAIQQSFTDSIPDEPQLKALLVGLGQWKDEFSATDVSRVKKSIPPDVLKLALDSGAIVRKASAPWLTPTFTKGKK